VQGFVAVGVRGFVAEKLRSELSVTQYSRTSSTPAFLLLQGLSAFEFSARQLLGRWLQEP
jgi:hypothetical protein